MDWAVSLEQKAGREGILVLLSNRDEAEDIARALRAKGHRVVVSQLPAGFRQAKLTRGPIGVGAGS